ncbi:MAG: hypothetical protein WCY08_05970 [Rhodocyclaceae bacterium]
MPRASAITAANWAADSLPTELQPGFLAGHALLMLIQHTVRMQVMSQGDHDIGHIARLVRDALPPPGPAAAGFALALGEYLAMVADGDVPTPGHAPVQQDAWRALSTPGRT